MSARYYAVEGSDAGTCQALRWAWVSVSPMVIAKGDDGEHVLADAIARAGHDDIHVHDTEAEG